MKRNDLEVFGLEKEAVDKIMDMNGADIEQEKAKTKAAENERDNYKEQLDTATGELDKLKELKPEEMHRDEDIKKALETVKESDAYLFGADEPFQNPVGPTGNSGGGSSTLVAMRAAAGLPPEK